MYGGWWKGFLADHHRIYCCSCIVVAVCIWLYWCIFILLHHPGLESCGVNGHTSAGVEPRVASMRTVWIPGRHKLLKSAKAAMKLTTQSPKCALRWPNKRSWKSSTNVWQSINVYYASTFSLHGEASWLLMIVFCEMDHGNDCTVHTAYLACGLAAHGVALQRILHNGRSTSRHVRLALYIHCESLFFSPWAARLARIKEQRCRNSGVWQCTSTWQPFPGLIVPWQPLLSKNHGCWMRIQAGNGREEKCGRLSYMISRYIIEGSLEVKLPTIWTDEKQSR